MPNNPPENHDRRNALIIVAALLLGYFIFFSSAENAISHNFVSFKQNDATVSTAKINVPVTLTLDFYSNSLLGYSGIININIYKDVPLTDTKLTFKQAQLNIPFGIDKSQRITMDFTPDEVTGTILREYYYTITDSTGKVLYDPGRDIRASLKVSTTASGGTTPRFVSLTFNDKPQITVTPGTSITTKVTMSGEGSGTLKVDIRKDYQIIPDGDPYTILSKEVVIDGSTVIQFDNWIAQSQGLGFREYFAKIYWNNDLIYDPQDPAQREYVKLSSGGTPPPPPPTGSISLKSVTWNAIANQASTVTLNFHLTGTISQSVTIDVREDVFLSDKAIQSQSCSLIGTDKDVTCTVSFTSPAANSKIFIRVPGIYDSSSPDARFADGTEIYVPSSGGGTTPTPTQTTPTPTPTTTPSPTPGSATLTNIGFTTGTTPSIGAITVNKGQNVNVYAYIYTTGAISGNVLVQINKDKVLDADSTVTSLNKGFTINNAGYTWIYVGAFSPDQSTSTSFLPGTLRQYFGRGSTKSSGFEYDPQDENTRSRVYVN